MGVGLVAVPSPAHAATTEWYFSANTGATYVKALGGTVSSDLTAASGISGGPDTSSKNSTLSANAAGLLSAGAAETRTTATRNNARDLTVNSYARVAGVNLLNGLIKIDAVETDINTIAKADGTHTVNGGTKFLGIKIAGVNLPATIPLNYGVSIPNVAAISLNNVTHASKDGLTATLGWGLAVQAPRRVRRLRRGHHDRPQPGQPLPDRGHPGHRRPAAGRLRLRHQGPGERDQPGEGPQRPDRHRLHPLRRQPGQGADQQHRLGQPPGPADGRRDQVHEHLLEGQRHR
ncbi:hypothetical protein G5V59_22605 [Nocardioides sp. W3-2-3]|nr:hypothetical protein [Nocardioides convexus]